jgi:tyrosyl-tRNA synthetase
VALQPARETMGLVELVEAAFKVSETNIPSRSEIRRLIQQGGVQLDGQKLVDPQLQVSLKDGQVFKIGKRTVVKVQLRK